MNPKANPAPLGHFDMKTNSNLFTHISMQAKDEIGEMFSSYVDF
ncbi:integrase [Streptococcus sp. NLN64]|nr:integrase [Streptococcus sp. NLN64]MBG9366573.1 integrase [Streptococcus sp. NLN64]